MTQHIPLSAAGSAPAPSDELTAEAHPDLWQLCLDFMMEEVSPDSASLCLSPLQADLRDAVLHLYAPNPIVKKIVEQRFLQNIREIVAGLSPQEPVRVELSVGTAPVYTSDADLPAPTVQTAAVVSRKEPEPPALHASGLNHDFTFETFVEGKSNQLARAAALQVAENAGGAFNPLFLYGGVGLGKTHLMHAVGNAIARDKPGSRVVYLHAERFVADMVEGLRKNTINEFKRFYRSVDALLIDDIQFFARKERTQEEFFHTFNALLEGGKQVILSCDRFPKDLEDTDERLISRYGMGLTVIVDPPELETRVAILKKKAEQAGVILSNEGAFFIAQNIRSNVRELEGALRMVISTAAFKDAPLSMDLIQDALKNTISVHSKKISIDTIKQRVAEYYRIKINDLNSKRRTKDITRPRQMAMALCKELTDHSFPHIGREFGGRDHTTVIHACKLMVDLKAKDSEIRHDYEHFLRSLTSR